MNVTPNAKVDHQRRSKLSLEQFQNQDSVDELPLPPTPTVHQEYRYEAISDIRRTPRTSTSSTISPKRSQSQPPKSLPVMNGNGNIGNGNIGNVGNGNISNVSNGHLGITPPMIDRHSKPSRISRDGYHTYNSHRSPQATDGSLDRRTHMRDMKMVRIKFKFIYHILDFMENSSGVRVCSL